MSYNNNIPVVQGVAVNSNSASAHTPYVPAPSNYENSNNYGEGEFIKGEPQPKQFQDVFFAVLFLAHLGVMAYVLTVGTVSFANNNEGNDYDYSGVTFLVVTCGLIAVGLSTVALGFMFHSATVLVKMALIFSVASSAVVGILGLLSGDMMLTILGFVSCALGCCYAYFVWARIPVRTLLYCDDTTRCSAD